MALISKVITPTVARGAAMDSSEVHLLKPTCGSTGVHGKQKTASCGPDSALVSLTAEGHNLEKRP